MISPKVIDVEGNRVGYENENDWNKSLKKRLSFYETEKRINSDSMFGYGAGVGFVRDEDKLINKSGRFPTQLFTNIDDDKYKYVKNIKNKI